MAVLREGRGLGEENQLLLGREKMFFFGTESVTTQIGSPRPEMCNMDGQGDWPVVSPLSASQESQCLELRWDRNKD